ncbi:MAG: hypothetical protein J7M30_04790 [Deltaproteobacteria bacterium]|nr:hypothetical protein [Deltaproteobacteria bacterium]
MPLKNNRTHISWKVRCIDTETRAFFDKTRVLDSSRLSENKLSKIEAILSKGSHTGILSYKKYFKEISEPLSDKEMQRYDKFYNVLIPGYFEDQKGNSLDEYALCKILSGQDKPIILGNLNSVIRLGHSTMKLPENWQQKHSDIIAHFLQIWKQIAESRWSKSKNSIAYEGTTFKEAQLADLESLLYVSVYFRQLISAKDKAFKLACDTYNRFVYDKRKIFWVKEEHNRLNKCLNSKAFGPKLKTKMDARELIDLFWYGALFFHSSQEIEEEKKAKFRDLINQNRPEAVAFNLNSCFRELFNHVQNVAGLIHYDFAEWLHKYNLPKPDIMWHWSILGQSNKNLNDT